MKRNKTIDMFKETLGEINVPMRDLKHNVKLLKPLKDGIVNQIYDPRKAGQITYKLEDIFLISMIAMFAGAKTFEDFADFGEGNSAFFTRYFKIKRFAKHDTYNRVFALISPQSFEQILVDFAINVVDKLRKALKTEVQQPIINIDGKSENGTGENQGTKEQRMRLRTYHTLMSIIPIQAFVCPLRPSIVKLMRYRLQLSVWKKCT